MATATAPAPKIWGIVDSTGANVLAWDSISAVKYSDKSKVSSFPLEQGSFANYDKVANPYDLKLTVMKGGTVQDRKSFLSTLKTLKDGLSIVSVITPERTFLSANLEAFDYSQTTGKGQNLLIVELHLIEIRQIAPGGYAQAKVVNPKKPAAKDKADKGKQQTTTAPSKTAAAAIAGFQAARGAH